MYIGMHKRVVKESYACVWLNKIILNIVSVQFHIIQITSIFGGLFDESSKGK